MSKVFLLPVAVFLVYETTFFCTSIAAILQGHVVAPYISDGGTSAPESCFFSFFMNFGSILLSILIYIRYRHIEQLMYQHTELIDTTMNINYLALWVGLGACTGACIVGNFQLIHLPKVHYFGAFTCFGLGLIFLWFQAYITYDVRAYIGSGRLANIRFALAAIGSYFFFVTILTSCIFVHSVLKLTKEYMPFCDYHRVSTTSEWIIATIFNVFILTFAIEFRYITFDHPTILITKREISNTNELIDKVSYPVWMWQ